MTVFLTPDGRPFFGGTYFPKPSGSSHAARRGRRRLAHTRTDLVDQAAQLTGALGRCADARAAPTAARRRARSNAAAEQLGQRVRRRVGRLRRGTEVPPDDEPRVPAARLRAGAGEQRSSWSRRRLDAMASGGIYDHLGGGFARYSVDEQWLVPHFEKMLYDQALLARVLPARLAGHRARPGTARCVDETIGYVLRDLRHPGGGFFSAEDADSEGVRGQVLRLVARRGARRARRRRRRRRRRGRASPRPGNFEGRNILHRRVAAATCSRPDAVERARVALFDAREQRVAARPRRQGAHRVERAVAGHARRGRGRHRATTTWLSAAVRQRRVPARATCAATTAGGCARGRPTAAPATWPTPPTTPRSSTPSPGWPRPPARPAGSPRAGATADALLDLFWDDDARAGCSPPADDAEQLVARQKDLLDNATPSANCSPPVGAAPPGRAHRRAAVRQPRRPDRSQLGRAARRAHRLGVRPPPRGRRPAPARASPRSPWSATGPTSWPRCSGATGPRGAGLGRAVDSPLWDGPQDGLAYVCRTTPARHRPPPSRSWRRSWRPPQRPERPHPARGCGCGLGYRRSFTTVDHDGDVTPSWHPEPRQARRRLAGSPPPASRRTVASRLRGGRDDLAMAHDPATSTPSASSARRWRRPRRRHDGVAGVVAAARRRPAPCSTSSTPSSAARPTSPSPPPTARARRRRARPWVLPVQQRRGGRGELAAAASVSPSSTGTCTTATAPRTSSTTTRGCCTCRPTSRRCPDGPATRHGRRRRPTSDLPSPAPGRDHRRLRRGGAPVEALRRGCSSPARRPRRRSPAELMAAMRPRTPAPGRRAARWPRGYEPAP